MFVRIYTTAFTPVINYCVNDNHIILTNTPIVYLCHLNNDYISKNKPKSCAQVENLSGP